MKMVIKSVKSVQKLRETMVSFEPGVDGESGNRDDGSIESCFQLPLEASDPTSCRVNSVSETGCI